MIWRLYRFWRPSAGTIAAGGALLIVAAGFELLQPWPVKWLVDSVLVKRPDAGASGVFGISGEIDPSRAILYVCLAIVVLALLHKAATLISQFLLIIAGNRTVERLRGEVCHRLLEMPLAYHDRTKVGDSLYRVAYDTPAAQTLLSGAIVPMASGVILLAGITIAMWRIDPLLTAVSLATTPIFWLLIKIFGRAIERRTKGYRQRESSLVSFMQEALLSVPAIQAFTRERNVADQFNEHTASSTRANARLTLAQLGFSACVGVAMAAGTAAVVWFGAHRVLDGRLTLGEMLVFLAYLGMLYQPMNAFSNGSSVAQSAKTQLAGVFEVLELRPAIANRFGALRPDRIAGRIELRDVSFQYDEHRPVLDEIGTTIEPGEVIALVGRTGAGKSTLAKLLLRFYDPTNGSVLLDGRDLRDLDLLWLREQVGVVLQDPIIFSATIAENIAFGRPGATREQIENAARQAQLDDFIRTSPEGYDTELGERGVNLSGGQRQRLA
ncbi:MAG TPA: ABC transporter ATP-binding protein, partial [Pirellulales bacterium]|nr:ABC transporter ATP-binding protein [Pirellulales bacterium]